MLSISSTYSASYALGAINEAKHYSSPSPRGVSSRLTRERLGCKSRAQPRDGGLMVKHILRVQRQDSSLRKALLGMTKKQKATPC